MLIGDVSQGYTRHAVICDQCNTLIEFMMPIKVIELKAEGWEGDMLCERCWETSPLSVYDPFEFDEYGFIGFLETEEDTELKPDRLPQVSIRVAREKRVEVWKDDQWDDKR